MNRAKFEKEKKNIKLLFQYFLCYGIKLGFWTLTDGVSYRLGIEKIYKFADQKRYGTCKEYLRKNYSKVIMKYKNVDYTMLNDKISEDSDIWLFWWQGENNFPYPINLCVESIRKHAGKHKVVLITKENYKQYVNLPGYIIKKFEMGIISVASFSDILRFELLYKYGGIWLDSTYFFTGELSKEIYNNNFYSISNPNGRNWVITKDIWSISFMAMTKKHIIASYMCDFYKEYWKKENVNIAYLLSDCFISIAYEDIPTFKKIIDSVPANNVGVFDLLGPIRNKLCTQSDFVKLMGNTYIHKLTYKEKYVAEVSGKKTYFGRLIEYKN